MKNITVTVAWVFVAIIAGLSNCEYFGNSLYGEEMPSISCKVYGFIHITTAVLFAAIAWLGGNRIVSCNHFYITIYSFSIFSIPTNIPAKLLDVIRREILLLTNSRNNN